MTPGFTPEDRSALLDSLVSAARDDVRIVAAALTGSAALGRTDEWSDIDLALSVHPSADTTQVDLSFWPAAGFGATGRSSSSCSAPPVSDSPAD